MPTFDVDDTIAAIASASGPAVRGIIRISGPDCQSCLLTAFQLPGQISLASRLENLKAPTVLEVSLELSPGTALPGQLLYWPNERSYTRQPSAEFHTLGSPPLLNRALAKICQGSVRLAEPGEFTLRAFLSGRLDLTQAEAVLATIDAHDQDQLGIALKQLAGGLSGPLTDARDQLVLILAELEAGLDFVEEDIEFISRDALLQRLGEAQSAIQTVTAQIDTRDHQSDSFRVALVGPPNAGKSSLFNCILGSDRAIVTDVAGTTTDYLTAPVTIHGARFEFVDTAGIEETSQPQSIAGQAQSQSGMAARQSVIQLRCFDASRRIDGRESENLRATNDSVIIVRTKSELPVAAENVPLVEQLRNREKFNRQYIETSSRAGWGIEDLVNAVFETAIRMINSDSDVAGSTVLRAADSLRLAEQSVARAILAAQENLGEELIAAEIRQSLDELGTVVGTVYTDDILDVVFSRFCIGK